MTPALHLSLRVRDLDRSVDFYRRLFGEPAKRKPDYAKFVAADPELHLALVPGGDGEAARGSLSHLGIRVGSIDEVERRRADLRGRGLAPENEARGECCYAVQEKFWLTDPDGNRWEIYTVLQDVEAHAVCAPSTCCSTPAVRA